jgi:hypothetical protein
MVEICCMYEKLQNTPSAAEAAIMLRGFGTTKVVPDVKPTFGALRRWRLV